MAKFTDDEKKLLEPYVTEAEGNIFCIKNLPGMTGPVYARYSRAKGGFREVLLKEFIKEGVIDPQHASDLIDRILIAFGDDSVGELEGAHVSFEEISVLATKEIEDRRIGGSPIEQSTRYVFYDHKIDGKYRYYRDPKIMASKFGQEYEKVMNHVFDTYCRLIKPMKELYKGIKPRSQAVYDVKGSGSKQLYGELTNETDKKAFRLTYNADLRTRACDTLRNLLPISTKTNVGVFGNGRFFQYVLSALYTSPYSESKSIAEQAHRELNKLIPVYVKRARKNDYLADIHASMQRLADSIIHETAPYTANDKIDLLDMDDEALANKLRKESKIDANVIKTKKQAAFDDFTVTCMIYPYTRHSFRQLRTLVSKMPDDQKKKIIDTYIGQRGTRRDRPYRALEAGYPYTFDLITDFGTYKDLMRHRMNTQLRQRFSPLLGFQMPPDLEEAGYADIVNICHDRVLELYEKIYPFYPNEASYLTLHGHNVRWLLGMNDREAMHLLELRSTPQGHPSYRRVSQLMHQAIKKQSPWRAAAMKFVDYGEYHWARGDSEARQRVKEKKLENRLQNKN
jgi:thymidylate synthase ThyX